MKLSVFFDGIRGTSMFPRLSAGAVSSIEIIIEEAARIGVSDHDLAYMLATARWEVGVDMQPRRESLNYSVSGLLNGFSRSRISAKDAEKYGRKPNESSLSTARQMAIANILYGGDFGLRELGNKRSGDGWAYRGGGYPQTTGRANYDRVGKIVGVDLVSNPERIVEPRIAVKALVIGMVRGIYTNRKLSDFDLPRQYFDARSIINADRSKVDPNTKKLVGNVIADYANTFLKALRAAGYSPDSAVIAASSDAKVASAVMEKGDSSWIGILFATLFAGTAAVGTYVTSKTCDWFGFFCGG